MRVFVIILLIILATVGIGITGVAPPLPKSRKRGDNPVKIELVEDKEQKKNAGKTVKIN